MLEISDLLFGYLFMVLQDKVMVFTSMLIGLFGFVILKFTLQKWKNQGSSPIAIVAEFLPEVKALVGVGSKPRFRKRDKVLFYGRKMLRKVKSISGQVHSGPDKKRRMVLRFARKLLELRKEVAPMQLKVLGPPAEYLEEDNSSKTDTRVPLDVMYLLRSMRIFEHFEESVFAKLCQHAELMIIPAGTNLFRIGDPDENVYVVQNGKLNVYITGHDTTSLVLKCVKTGESVTSFLSFTDVLTGHPNLYKTVSARAVEDSTILRLPMRSFHKIFEEYPNLFIHVMQVIMVRLQRVTFIALHQYLGLSAELVNPGSTRRPGPFTGSPIRNRPKEFTDLNKDDVPCTATDTSLDDSPNDQPSENTSVGQSNMVNSSHQSKSSLELKFGAQPDMVPDIDNLQQTASSTSSSSSSQILDLQVAIALVKDTMQLPEDATDEEILILIATEAFVKELGLESDVPLRGKVEIREVPTGTYMMKEESHKDCALIYLLSGSLIVSQKMSLNEEEVNMYTAHPGEIVGGLAALTGEPSYFTIRAKQFSKIALLSKNTFYAIMRDFPRVVLHIAHTVVMRLSPFVRQVDFALDWVFIESGRAVYRQGDESDCTYIVLSGRLRSVITHGLEAKKELVGEYGRGDLVGVVEMVTQTPRSTTVMAVRDSELAKLPEGLFNVIKLKFPNVVTRLINLLGHRIIGSWQKPTLSPALGTRPSQVNFSTVAVIAISDDVPLTAFTYELYHSVTAIGSALRLTSEMVRKTLGARILDNVNEYRLTSWLAQQEDQHRITLYQCDLTYSPWTQRCVRQADCVLIVGMAHRGPHLGKIEKDLERYTSRTQRELVLLHYEGSGPPKNTVAWLNSRTWVSSHHHIQAPKRMFTRRSQYRTNELYGKVLMSEPNVHSDFSRLARWLTGTSVGLVLGGGGARGAAHVGMIKAIQEVGIPIDMVGGVSIGSFIGALWCKERNITTMTQKTREWSQKMTQWWRQILDLTYPMTSMFSGSDFNNTIRVTIGDTHIEDLWLPYFAVTTDITASTMRVHTHGCVWRYIRASMSLSGYMPPLCDPVDGHLLLDGGYVNNLPADVMRGYGAKHILAIDVGSQDDQDLTNYGDSLSGWWLLWKRWNPFTNPVKVPNLPDIQSRLAYVSCVRQLEEVKSSDYCEYIRPPIDKYKTLQFGSFDEIKDVGYQHGKTYFSGLLKAGALPVFKPAKIIRKKKETRLISGYTLSDMAQLVFEVSTCRKDRGDMTDTEDDYEADEEDCQEVGYVSEPSVGVMDKPKLETLHRRVGGSLSLSENELESEVEFSPLQS